MNRHALAVLEFPRLLDLVAERATSGLGAARIRALHPTVDRAWLESEHRRVAAMRTLVTADGGAWAPEPIPDLTEPLARLRIEGTLWTGPELLAGATLLRSSRRTREALGDERKPGMVRALLAPFMERLVAHRAEEDLVERAIGDDGTVKDEASPLLRRVRRDLRGATGELIALLERLASRLDPQHQVQDASVTVRGGRYVIPVRAAARNVVGGIVHDTSDTGRTLFVEPPAAIEFGNRIRELEAEEYREVERILRDLTDRLRPHRDGMLDALDALVALDSLYARARYAQEFACHPAELTDPAHGFAIRDGRHPLLLAQHGSVVPYDLEMLAEERTLLVSGPNTGGKTVLLKALGLASVMAQAGIPPTVGPESRVAIFDDVFADVGDEQSIQASLSTFSAHLKNLGEILRGATHDSLVLVDELGSGTDPLEGAALGGAILEDLTARGTMTVATTHLGALKELATEVRGVVNASLQFDAVALAPTYRLIKGVPGRSYGISIARRLQLPENVLGRAEERVPKAERDVNALLADLEARETQLADREKQAAELAEDAQRRLHRLADREERVRAREREAEKQARQEAKRYVLEARKELERTIKELERAGAEQLGDRAKEARRLAESLAEKQNLQLERLDNEERNVERKLQRGAPKPALDRTPIAAGDVVEVATLGGKLGRVVELRARDAVVTVGAMKMTLPLTALARSSQQLEGMRAAINLVDAPDVVAKSEIDLRGLRVGEIDDQVLTGIDDAVRADLRELRIIHGKGTGALRDRVVEMLRKDTRVKNFRMGAWNEGGAGVTVVELG
jgi:DNA mismatch repair protein MutS2